MNIFWNVVSAVVGAASCKVIAQHNGRNVKYSTIWGALFGLLAVFVYLIIGKKSRTTIK